MLNGWLSTVLACGASLAIAGVAAAETVRVALLPVVVNSNNDDTAYLGAGLADMLSARLEQSGEISIVRLDEGTTERADAIAAAQGAEAQFAVFGAYTQFGDGASLDLRCASVADAEDDSPRRVFIQAGTPSEIIPQLDELSQRMSRYMVGAAVALGPPSAPTAAPKPDAPAEVSGSEIADLQQRVGALERVIFNRAPEAESPAE